MTKFSMLTRGIRLLFVTSAGLSPLAAMAQQPTAAPETPAQPIVAAEEAAPPVPPGFVPYSGPFLERSTLTGDWMGLRSGMRDHGVTFDLSSTQFYQGVMRGGLDRSFSYGGRADYKIAIDGQKAGLWQGFFVNLHGETIYDKAANDKTGTLFPISIAQSVPVPSGNVTALTGVKFTQALSENFVLFAGKINTTDDVNQPFTGGAAGVNGFMNMAMVLSPALARTVPYSTFAGGFAVLKDMEPVMTFMVLDPNNTPTVSGFDTFFDRGVSIVSSVNVPYEFQGLKGHQGILGTYSNSKYLSLDGLPFFLVKQFIGLNPVRQTETGSWSVSYMFDQALGTVGCDPKRTWGVFGNASITDGEANPVRWFANVGLGGASPLECRKYDSFGAGYFYVGMSNEFKSLLPRIADLTDEHGFEAFYNVGLTPWCHLTSDFQIVSPVRGNTQASYTFGMRLKVDF